MGDRSGHVLANDAIAHSFPNGGCIEGQQVTSIMGNLCVTEGQGSILGSSGLRQSACDLVNIYIL